MLSAISQFQFLQSIFVVTQGNYGMIMMLTPSSYDSMWYSLLNIATLVFHRLHLEVTHLQRDNPEKLAVIPI